MKSAKSDRRVRYTKMVLRESLLELMKDRPIGKITTTELCAKADINRNTFYAHYASPFDLLTQIEKELHDSIMASIERSLRADSVVPMLLEILQSITENGDLCKILFSEYADKEFLHRIVNIAHGKAVEAWKAAGLKADLPMLEQLYLFTASGCVAVIQDWVQTGMHKSPREVALMLEKMTSSGLGGFLQR